MNLSRTGDNGVSEGDADVVPSNHCFQCSRSFGEFQSWRTISRSRVAACRAMTSRSCFSLMLPKTNWDRSSFMKSVSLRIERTVSTMTRGRAASGGSSRASKSASIWGSRAGAHRSLRLCRISRRCMTTERRGDDVGDRGNDRVTSTGCFAGSRGVRATCMSWYRRFSRGSCMDGDGSESASNACTIFVSGVFEC